MKNAVLLGSSCGCHAGVPAVAQSAADRRIDATYSTRRGCRSSVRRSLPRCRCQPPARRDRRERSFTIEGLAPGVYTLRVSAAGFQFQDISVDLSTQTAQTVEVRLRPAGYTEQLIVTATRSEQRIADVPASVNVLTSEQIGQSPAVVADDVLRQIPTFSLFRRTSSIASHPTAQGVSLRGVGPSGVSRTLVLLDQVPFNDPFGGWVYWTRVPLMDTERIEIVDGATSSLYGNYAMGGVINIVTTGRAAYRIFKPQYGNRKTPKMDLFASDVGEARATFHATAFDTDGYTIVAEEERGPIDIPANVNIPTASGKLDYNPTDRVNMFFPAASSLRDRSNGKIGEVNDMSWKSEAAAWGCASPTAAMSTQESSSIARSFIARSSPFRRPFLRAAAEPDARSERADQPQSAPCCSGTGPSRRARERTSSRRATTSAGSTATERADVRARTGLTPLLTAFPAARRRSAECSCRTLSK